MKTERAKNNNIRYFYDKELQIATETEHVLKRGGLLLGKGSRIHTHLFSFPVLPFTQLRHVPKEF